MQQCDYVGWEFSDSFLACLRSSSKNSIDPPVLLLRRDVSGRNDAYVRIDEPEGYKSAVPRLCRVNKTEWRDSVLTAALLASALAVECLADRHLSQYVRKRQQPALTRLNRAVVLEAWGASTPETGSVCGLKPVVRLLSDAHIIIHIEICLHAKFKTAGRDILAVDIIESCCADVFVHLPLNVPWNRLIRIYHDSR